MITKWTSQRQLPNPSLRRDLFTFAPLCGYAVAFHYTVCASHGVFYLLGRNFLINKKTLDNSQMLL